MHVEWHREFCRFCSWRGTYCSDHGIRFEPERWIPAPDIGNIAVANFAYGNMGFGFFVHAHFSTRIIGSVFHDNVQGGVDFDRSLNTTLQNSVTIGNSGRRGKRYPGRAGLEVLASCFPQTGGGKIIRDVACYDFRFLEVCLTHTIGIDPQDRMSAAGWLTTSTTVRDCKFLDGSVPMNMKYAMSGRNDM